MSGVLEFHGRLARADRRPANPGDYRLLFQLHGHSRIGGKRDKVYWEETLEKVPVSSGGFYRVVLGRSAPLSAKYFDGAPRWMSVQVVRSGRLDTENGARVPVMGQQLHLVTKIIRTEEQLADLHRKVQALAESSPRVDKFLTRINRQADAISSLLKRTLELEDDSNFLAVVRRLEMVTDRLDDVDKDEGRLDRLELELEDIIGPDGDVVDLNERMDRVEGHAPELIAQLRQRERDAPAQLHLQDLAQSMDRSQTRLEEFDAVVGTLQDEVAECITGPLPTPDAIGAVRRSGDAMTGGLTINRGGLAVLSGGITSRGATVTTLEASNMVKTPKAIVDSLELRGDLTVDSTLRVLQIRCIEGRQGSARRDGALHLNRRGGGEVVVGHPEVARGMEIHGSLRVDRVQCGTGAVAQVFDASGDLRPGDVVRVNDAGTKVQRVRKANDPRVVGVVTDTPGVLGGGAVTAGSVAVALYGVVECRVVADSHPIRAGDLLVSSRVVGHAQRCSVDADPAPGTVFGKALAPLDKGRGTVLVLLGGR